MGRIVLSLTRSPPPPPVQCCLLVAKRLQNCNTTFFWEEGVQIIAGYISQDKRDKSKVEGG